MAYKPNMSEAPNALVGASEWAEAEIERMRREELDSKELYESIKPYREEAFRKIHEKENREAAN